MRTAFLALALTVALAGFAEAQENKSYDISNRSYGAIAYSPATGKYAYACDERSRATAEKAALEKCGADDATIACWINRGFCSLALGNDKSCWGVGWAYGDGASTQAAKEKALADCRERTTGAYVALTISSDGQFISDRKDHTITIDKKGNVYDGHGNPITPTPSGTASAATERSPAPRMNSSPSGAATAVSPAAKMSGWPPDDKK